MADVRSYRPLRPIHTLAVPYTGSWTEFSPYLTIRPNGELYLTIGNSGLVSSVAYRSENYGRTWEPILTQAVFGTNFNCITPTSAGWVCTRDAGGAFKFSADLVTWVSKVSELEPYIEWRGVDGDCFCPSWAPGSVWVSASGKYNALGWLTMPYSADGGLTWDWSNNRINADYDNGGRVRVDAALTAGFRGGASAGGAQIPLYSTEPATIGAEGVKVWTASTSTYRSTRPGIDFPTVVCGAAVGLNNFGISTDSGANFAAKAIPAGMVMAAHRAIQDITVKGNLILTHLCDEAATPGIYKSTDLGDSWTRIHAAFGTDAVFSGIQIDPDNADIVYAWGSSGFFRSENGGTTWVASNAGLELSQS